MTYHTLPSDHSDSNEEISQYLQDLAMMPVLSPGEEQKVIQLIAASPFSTGAQAARTKLIEANLCVVVRLARGYQHFGVDLADLVQEGNVALMKAAQQFDPQRHQRFRSFVARRVSRTLRQVVQNHLRERCLTNADIMPIRPLRTQVLKALAHDALDEATLVDEIPEERLLSLESLLEDGSLDRSYNEERSSAHTYLYEENDEADPDEVVCKQELGRSIGSGLQCLTRPERAVLTCRYLLEASLTLEEVGRMLGVSRERVRQIEERAIRKMRHPKISKTLLSLW